MPVREFALPVYAQELTREPRSDDPSCNATCGGRSFEVPVEDVGDDLCSSRPDEPAKAAALGDFPFTTTVTLTLAGRLHEATAVCPDDEIEGNEPSVALSSLPSSPDLRPPSSSST